MGSVVSNGETSTKSYSMRQSFMARHPLSVSIFTSIANSSFDALDPHCMKSVRIRSFSS